MDLKKTGESLKGEFEKLDKVKLKDAGQKLKDGIANKDVGALKDAGTELMGEANKLDKQELKEDFSEIAEGIKEKKAGQKKK